MKRSQPMTNREKSLDLCSAQGLLWAFCSQMNRMVDLVPL